MKKLFNLRRKITSNILESISMIYNFETQSICPTQIIIYCITDGIKMRATGFEPATVGFGVQRSTVGATPSCGEHLPSTQPNEFAYNITPPL